jgi:hypothetical protein
MVSPLTSLRVRRTSTQGRETGDCLLPGLGALNMPLIMNIGPYLGPINQPVDLESIENLTTELMYVYIRRSYNPNKKDKPTTFSTQHEQCSALEFLAKAKMSNFVRGLRNLKMVHHCEEEIYSK